MPASVKLREPAAFGISARMARALTDRWRIRILSELSVRPLSPSRFVEEVGGELTHVARCFRQLADWGYIEVIEERPGRRHGAAVEHVYRGIQRVHFNTSAWKTVPRSSRDSVSRSAIEAYFARIAEAVEAGTFDEEVDRHLSWDGVALDRFAWQQLGSRLDEVLAWLPELAVEAAGRLGAGGEQIPTVVGLSAFRSPHSPAAVLQASRFHQGPPSSIGTESLFAFGPRFVKALSNEWRCRILMELSTRPMSPSQFVEEVGGSMTHISRCFRELADLGLVEVLTIRNGGTGGGGVERIYRGTHRPYFDNSSWATLPRILREEMSQWFLASYVDRVSEAIDAGTFDAEVERHFSWKRVLLDRQAWAELAKRLDEVLGLLPGLESDSLERTEEVEDLIPTTVGLAAFRAPAP